VSVNRKWSPQCLLRLRAMKFLFLFENALPEKTLGIRGTIVGIVSVHIVAAIAENLLALVHLSWTGAGLGILASHASNTDNRHAGTPDKHKGHLEEDLELRLNWALDLTMSGKGYGVSKCKSCQQNGAIAEVLPGRRARSADLAITQSNIFWRTKNES